MGTCEVCGQSAIVITITYAEDGTFKSYCFEHSPYRRTPEQEAEDRYRADEWRRRYAEVEARYADYMAVLKSEQERTHTCGPHCDNLVLHRPENCRYCADYPALHQARRELKIAYTGEEPREGERGCPAEEMRPKTTIDRWGGNVAWSAED